MAAKDPFAAGSIDDKKSSFGETVDWGLKFGKSALESIPELIGYTPSTTTQEFRQDNPVSGFVSQLGGMAVPYLGWYKAASMVPKFASTINAIGNVQKHPILTNAAREALKIAPFEIGRVGISQIPNVGGDKSFKDMAFEGAINIAGAGGIGGILGGLTAGGQRNLSKVASVFPGVDLAMPLPLQARKMREIIDSGTLSGEQLDRARTLLFDTLRDARGEMLSGSSKYVGPIDPAFLPGSDTRELQKQFNRLMRIQDLNPKSFLEKRAFAVGEARNFKTAAEWKDTASRAGFTEGFEENGQFFRHIKFDTTKTKSGKVPNEIDSNLTKNMSPVSADTFMSREADDGMFLMARKISGKPGKGDKTDEWVLWKTDQPGKFLPGPDAWAKSTVAQNAWMPGANVAADGGPIYNAAKGYTEMFPLDNARALGAAPDRISKAIDALLPAGVVGKGSEAFARAKEMIREYLAPRQFQFKNSPRANWLVNGMKTTYENAETMVQKLMYGDTKVDAGKNLLLAGLTKQQTGALGFTPVRDAVLAVPEEAFPKFHKIWREGLTTDKITDIKARLGHTPETDYLYDPAVNKLVFELERVNNFVKAGINKAEDAVGKTATEAPTGHLGLARKWEGDTRVIIKNESDEIVAQAGGPNRKAALANADELVAKNPGWKIDKDYQISQGNLPADVKPVVFAPSFMLEKQGLRGFTHDTKPFTREEFIKGMDEQLRAQQKYQAGLSVDDVFGAGMERLQREDPAAYRMFQARKDDYSGKPSTFAKWQNQVTDAVLAPILGQNSATKIVEHTNTALFNLQLGFGKISFPVLNALTFIQNVIPENAFVMGKTLPETLAARYSHFAAGGTKGPVGGMGVLNPIKMVGQSFAEMRSPSPELSAAVSRAMTERVLSPKMVEEFVGKNAIQANNLKDMFKSAGNFAGGVRLLSEWMPTHSENFARTQAFTNGYITARDFLKNKAGGALNEQEIYKFAKEFTENTMYMYAASDRPRVFTTPLGSSMGLFKNWLFHFMGATMEYAGEGIKRGNWSPLLWQTTGTFSLGGLAATPMWWAANQFSKQWSGKSATEFAYEQMGSGADGVLYGLPAAMTGISLYSNVATPMANPTRDASQLFGVVAYDRMKQMGKLVGAAFDHYQATGAHPAQDVNTRQLLIRAFAPTTLYRAMGAMSEPGTIIQMGTDRPQLKNMTPMSRIFYSVGFNPVELDRATQISQELYEKHNALKGMTTKLGNAWADAESSGRTEQMGMIMRQATVWGVDVSKVVQEGMKEMTRRRMDVIERTMRPGDIPLYQNAIQRHLDDTAARAAAANLPKEP